MRAWNSASNVFQGGTQQILELRGKKVKANSSLFGVRLYDAINHIDATTTIPVGLTGFISDPHEADLLIAFAKDPKKSPTSLEALARSGDFFVVAINEPTFKARFSIET